ncbi:DUF3786 domain-containing protein [Acetobacterium paludosum]|uniref:DUF3786 domain-containing protein n=1 Tax=Acetobacterium paludosum TaxID=52693 RepID=A0A923KTL8_9FIRM|nr:DUF3786 domain-containing protein [Acetobacterium paludosum]MBC3889567.1 DUF3786 domain-containing protein [Acetobacterium paludosum]
MEIEITNNYEKACEAWRLKFLKMDHQQLLEKLPEIKPEEGYLTLKLFGQKFGIHSETGKIISLENSLAADRNNQLIIYTLLWYASPQAVLKNKWVPFRELKGASPFTTAFEKHVLVPFAQIFSGQTEKLSMACIALGGVKLPHSDAGCQIKAFECMPMQFLFWDGDDEFPAQANILFDDSATDFIHVESTVTIAVEGVQRLAAAAGIEIKDALY